MAYTSIQKQTELDRDLMPGRISMVAQTWGSGVARPEKTAENSMDCNQELCKAESGQQVVEQSWKSVSWKKGNPYWKRGILVS